MAALSRIRRARKAHTCENCRTPVTVGQTYEILAVTPGDNGNAGDHWQIVKVHQTADCPLVPKREARQ